MDSNQLNRYQIGTLLGEGKWASVYKGVDQLSGQQVAIKVFKPEVAADVSLRNVVIPVVRKLQHLRHPCIMRVLDFYHSDKQLVCIYEYIEGKSLDDYIKTVTGAIPEQRLIPFYIKILEAFAFAHSQQILHLDLRSDTLRFMPTGEPKVMDFGFAPALEPYRNLSNIARHIDSLPYRSPEELDSQVGMRPDVRSDVYSLGVVLFQLLTGRLPHNNIGLSEFQYLSKLVNERIPTPSSVYPNISLGMDDVVLKATAKYPDDRFQSIAEFVRALEVKPESNRQEFMSYQVPDYPMSSYPPVSPYPAEPYLPVNYQANEPIRQAVQNALEINRLPLQKRFALADPGKRLAAAIIDGLLGFPLMIAMILTNVISGSGGFGAGMAVLCFFAIIAYQWYMLSTEGQSIGKKEMGIRIVKSDTGEKGDFVSNVLIRNILNGFLSCIPFYGLIDSVLCLGDTRQCIHDQLAQTVVIEDNAIPPYMKETHYLKP